MIVDLPFFTYRQNQIASVVVAVTGILMIN
jgi:hypothetical protein